MYGNNFYEFARSFGLEASDCIIYKVVPGRLSAKAAE
jgi:hypothetical protein